MPMALIRSRRSLRPRPTERATGVCTMHRGPGTRKDHMVPTGAAAVAT